MAMLTFKSHAAVKRVSEFYRLLRMVKGFFQKARLAERFETCKWIWLKPLLLLPFHFYRSLLVSFLRTPLTSYLLGV